MFPAFRTACLPVLLFSLTVAQAQESVNKELDSCIHTEQVQTTAKGAALGAMAGLLKTLASGKDKDLGKNVAVGAVAGGAAGFAVAYYKAVGTCYKKNSSWLPESKIERGSDYEQARAQLAYRPEQGVVAKVLGVQMADSSQPGSPVPVITRFGAMSPDGAEVDVTVERRLFATNDGKEQELQFPGRASEQRKVAAGGHIDTITLPVPKEMATGTSLRYQVSVSAAGQQPSVVSATTVLR